MPTLITIKRIYITLFLFIIAAWVVGLDFACRQGWGFAGCTPWGLSIYPPTGGGETVLSEAVSLTVLMIGAIVALAAGFDRHQPRHKRVALVFFVLFAMVYLGENNLFRDDVRTPILALILVWVSIELLLLKRILPILILFLATMLAFLGSLGDHTMYIQFQHATGEKISHSPLAGAQTVFGPLEEITEFLAWTLYVLAALMVLQVRLAVSQRVWFGLCVVFALLAITVGDTLLQLRAHEYDTVRKAAFFTAFSGVIAATVGFYLCSPRATESQKMLARAHAALFAVSLWSVTVLAPTIITHEHNKTVSEATWVLPLLALYFYLHHTSRKYRALDKTYATSKPELSDS